MDSVRILSAIRFQKVLTITALSVSILWMCLYLVFAPATAVTTHSVKKTGQIKISGAEASRVSAPSKYGDYYPMNAIDGSWNTAWNAAWSPGSDTWLMLVLETPALITGVDVLPGYAKNTNVKYGDVFKMNYRIKRARIDLSNGFNMQCEFRDLKELQHVDFNSQQRASWVKLTILDVYPSSKWKDVAISEFSISLR